MWPTAIDDPILKRFRAAFDREQKAAKCFLYSEVAVDPIHGRRCENNASARLSG